MTLMKSLFRFGQHQLFFLNTLVFLFGAGIVLADNSGLVSPALLAVLGGTGCFSFGIVRGGCIPGQCFFLCPDSGIIFSDRISSL